MYVNLNALIHKLSLDLFTQTFMTQVPADIESSDSAMLELLAKFCEIDLWMETMPPSWVEINGDEDYVKHSLLDIS